MPIEPAIAEAWSILVAQRTASGKPISPMDGFIAATALVHDLSLVARNLTDFKTSLKAIINPWSG